ncbi:hypothetical protein DW272_02675 [Blautia obeum]|uniref:Uncharacterized protein n=1 Tax=Blautia obeum TaxID=40520 RepID=A0A414SKK9_9FIRM|nr:hypothetical protein [Blautia obeum]RHG20130.1 hypothetical protein DW272_02675 [Blautia obeum]
MTKEEAVEIIKKDMSNIMADENTFRRQYDLHQAEALALQALSNEILESNPRKAYVKMIPGNIVYLKNDKLFAIVLDVLDDDIPDCMVYDENGIVQKISITEVLPIISSSIKYDTQLYFDKMMSELRRMKHPTEN